MPKPCSVCTFHGDRDALDKDLIAGRAITQLSKAHGLSESAIRRHREHLQANIAKAGKSSASELLRYLDTLTGEAERLQAKAEEEKDTKTALIALRERARLLELRARVSGEIKSSPNSVTNIAVLDSATSRRIAEIHLARHRELPADVRSG